jgi:hypothetical protein
MVHVVLSARRNASIAGGLVVFGFDLSAEIIALLDFSHASPARLLLLPARVAFGQNSHTPAARLSLPEL